MDRSRFLVVVASSSASPTYEEISTFVTNGNQGVNYHRGVWHHALLAIDRVADFLVIDRKSPTEDCEHVRLTHPLQVSDQGGPDP